MTKQFLLLTALTSIVYLANSQSLPFQWTLDESSHMLTIGGVEHTGLYDENQIKEIHLQFEAPTTKS